MGDFDISQISPANEQSSLKTRRSLSSVIKRLLIFFSLFLIILSSILIYSYKYRNRPNDITLGYTDQEGIALVSLSKQLGYLDNNEIEVDFRTYDDELKLIEAISSSKIDVAFVEDLSITMASPDQHDNRIIASVLNAEKYFFVVDTKKGIFDVSSLAGEDLGVFDSYKTDYWLEKSLGNSGVNKKDIVLKNYKLSKLAEELADAKVSGVFTWQPYVYDSETFEGSDVQQMVLPIQNEEGAYTYLLTSQSYIESNYQDLKKLLLSLIEAEVYIQEHKEVAIEYLTGEWSSEKRYVSDIFDTYNYSVNISQESKTSLSEKYIWSTSKSRAESDGYQIENIYYYNLLREIDPKRAEF